MRDECTPHQRTVILGGAQRRPRTQWRRVGGAKDSFRATDGARLGPRDKREDDGRWVGKVSSRPIGRKEIR